MLQNFIISLLLTVTLAGDADLFASVGVGSASARGFSWTYDIRNPDLIDPPGKIYWVLTNDGVPMTVNDIMIGNNPTQPNCFGQAVQVDSEIHEQRMDCSLTPGELYRFWVAVDYDGDGTEAVDTTSGGVPVIPQEDHDCDGIWSSCDANCIQFYSITQYPSGDGAGCEIGDEEERTCAPGTDLCPLGGAYDAYNPTPDGFDVGFTPDESSNTAGGMWYYMVTPVGASPTPEEIMNQSGGLCGSSYPITSVGGEDLQTATCGLSPDIYDVWVAQDPQGNGNPTIVEPLKQVTIPAALPTGNLFAHTPSETGHKISYDIDNPVATGKFYWMTVPLGSPNPTAAEIRDCSPPCCGSFQQAVPSPMTTIDAACSLTPGEYVVYGEVDTDGNGADASLANSGVAFQFTYAGTTSPATTTTTTTTTTAASTTTTAAPVVVSSTTVDNGAGSNTAPPVVDSTLAPGIKFNFVSDVTAVTTATTTAIPVTPAPQPNPTGAIGNYRVIYPGQECENDQIGDGITAHIHDTILLPNVRIGFGSDVARCAGYVAENRAQNGGCSTLFHTGGITGACRCVRLGYVCDRDESEVGRTIFKLCLSAETCSMVAYYWPDLALSETRGDTGDGLPAPPAQTGSKTLGLSYYLFIVLAVLSGIFVGVCGYLSLQPKRQMNSAYHISLDTNAFERTI